MRTKRHYIKLTPGQREELIQQIQAGVDWDTLMANFNVSRSTIYFYKDKIYGKNPAGKVKKKYMRNKKNAKAAAVKMGVWKVEEASGSNQEDGEVKPKPKDLAAHAAKPSTSSTTEIDSKPLRDLQNPSRFQAPRAAALRANMEIRLDNEFLEDRPRKGKPGPKRGKRRCIAPPVVSAAPIPMSIIPVTSPIPTPVTNLIATHITDPIAAPLAIPITAPVTSGKKEGRRGKAIRGKALRGVSRGRGFRGGRGRGVKIISQEVLLNKTIIHKNQRSLPDMQFEHITTGRTSPLNYMQEAGVSGSSDFSLADNLFETMTIDCSIPEPFIMESPRGTGSAHAHARDPLNSSFSPPSPKSANQLHVQHNFHSRRVLEALVNDEAFVDVTLTAEGRTISAHKLVLSAMSPYFQRVLQANPCRHPVVIMPPSVSFTHLSHIISFMYKGETTVQESELRSLIRTAELLQVSGFRLPNQSPVNDDSSATSSSFSGFSNPQRPSVDDRVIRITEERGTCEEPFHPGSRNVPQHIPVSHTSTLRRAPPVVITHSSQTSTVAPSLPVLNTPVLNTPILNTPVLNTPVLNTPSHSNTFTLATPTTFFLSPSTNPVIIKGRTGAIIPATSIPVISRGSPPSRSFQHRFSSTPVRQQTGTGEGRSGRMLSSPDSPGGGGTVLGVDLDIDIIKESTGDYCQIGSRKVTHL
ncbi:hypothetical protein Pmani_031458 [Petrolisthes manimaculis]|uniref:BTB domain-containing protein n=1 Tax=Petrolisthes manimaculis TaxID=1843537 RepID=A0AAE1TUU4_9EUCA|nr:hypothetical protein Pmani_031458 [Petrolisthes manimaculis]